MEENQKAKGLLAYGDMMFIKRHENVKGMMI
jgi:hypothetical protein